jgi:hypothetical protein
MMDTTKSIFNEDLAALVLSSLGEETRGRTDFIEIDSLADNTGVVEVGAYPVYYATKRRQEFVSCYLPRSGKDKYGFSNALLTMFCFYWHQAVSENEISKPVFDSWNLTKLLKKGFESGKGLITVSPSLKVKKSKPPLIARPVDAGLLLWLDSNYSLNE